MTVRILHGDCRDVLAILPAESVHCVVTSPPYWGLRDYGIPPTVWGGDQDCAHEWGEGLRIHKGGPHGDGIMVRGSRSVIAAQAACKDIDAGTFCSHCSAWRGALGLEPDYRLFVDNMVQVFRAVRRVLRKDGTLWLNLGDSYASTPSGAMRSSGLQGGKATQQAFRLATSAKTVPDGLKPKDLCGIPWRVAFALQEDGWYLRQDIIWSKPNPMPESVTDRCTKAHEYLFLLSKSARYFYDAEAIKEAPAQSVIRRAEYSIGGNKFDASRNDSDMGDRKKFSDFLGGRNKRSVWQVATSPFPEAHFATFPPELIEPCIKAGCPGGGTVLDPFGGAGTTGLVADRLQRNAILIELNPDYVAMAKRRIEGDAPLFADTTEAAE